MKPLLGICAVAIALGSCGNPSLAPCTVKCGTGAEACPDDATCGGDGFCHTNDDETCSCDTGVCTSTTLKLTEGGIRSMGATQIVGGSQLVRQGFESRPQQCNGSLCVRGGFDP
jgi:hypothetical protein